MRTGKFFFKIFTIGWIVSFFVSPTYAFDRQKVTDEIKAQKTKAEKLSDKLRDYAEKINDQFAIGTMYNEIGAMESGCYIIGKLHNKEKYVKSLEPTLSISQYDIKTKTDDNALDLRVGSIQLDNFGIAVDRILDLSEGEQITEWNLDCVGEFDIPVSAHIEQSGASTFYTLRNEGTTLTVLGEIEKDYAKKIKEAIDSNPSIEVIALGSGGGAVLEAITAGYYIREKQLSTTLYNNCYSACPLVFMSGVTRTLWNPPPELGFHQVYDKNGIPIEFNHKIYQLIYLYLTDMGIKNPKFIIEKMWSTPPDQISVIEDYEDLCKYNITTWIQRLCSHDDY